MVLWHEPDVRGSGLERLLWWTRPVGLALLVGWIATADNGFGWHGRALATALVGIGAMLGWAAILVAEYLGHRPGRWSFLALGVLSGLFFGWSAGGAQVFPFVTVGAAGAALAFGPALLVVAGTAVAVTIAEVTFGRPDELPWVLPVIALVALGGQVRRSYVQRAQQAEVLLEQAERARAAERRTAALDERARIAREIHDVLAHSLAALAVQLEAADVVLGSGDIDRGRDTVRRARALATDGLAETRRAVVALRDGMAPLPEALRAIASSYGTQLAPTVTVDGPARAVDPEASLALYRAAQEALTNVGKHAPGAAVALDLCFRPDELRLEVRNDAAPDGDRPLADSGSGVGLAGMRERAEALGGRVDAGPVGAGWRVRVTIPG